MGGFGNCNCTVAGAPGLSTLSTSTLTLIYGLFIGVVPLIKPLPFVNVVCALRLGSSAYLMPLLTTYAPIDEIGPNISPA
jgi:hypothetical protein